MAKTSKPGTKPDDFEQRRLQSMQARGLMRTGDLEMKEFLDAVRRPEHEAGDRAKRQAAIQAAIERLKQYGGGLRQYGGIDWDESSRSMEDYARYFGGGFGSRQHEQDDKNQQTGRAMKSFSQQTSFEQAALEAEARRKQTRLRQVEQMIATHPQLERLHAMKDFATGRDRLGVQRKDGRTLMVFADDDGAGEEVLRFLNGQAMKEAPPPEPRPIHRRHQCTWELGHDGVRRCMHCNASVLWASAAHEMYQRKPEPVNGLHPSDITEPGFYWWLPEYNPDNSNNTRPVDWTVVQVTRTSAGVMQFHIPMATAGTPTATEESVLGTFVGPLTRPTDYA